LVVIDDGRITVRAGRVDTGVRQEPCRSDRDAVDAAPVECAGHEIERTAGDAAPARFFTRVRGIEQRDPGSLTGKEPRGMCAGGTGTDDRDVEGFQMRCSSSRFVSVRASC
jgi:hypothetical protein